MSTRSVRISMLIKMNYHQYLENYTLKKIEDIDCQKTIKDINFTDLKNLFFRTRTKKYGYESNHAFISQEPCRCIIANALEQKVKRTRAQGGCQGTIRRRRTWQAAKSHGEPQAGNEPWISEWGNPAGVMSRHP